MELIIPFIFDEDKPVEKKASYVDMSIDERVRKLFGEAVNIFGQDVSFQPGKVYFGTKFWEESRYVTTKFFTRLTSMNNSRIVEIDMEVFTEMLKVYRGSREINLTVYRGILSRLGKPFNVLANKREARWSKLTIDVFKLYIDSPLELVPVDPIPF